jgi:hypothetical protein
MPSTKWDRSQMAKGPENVHISDKFIPSQWKVVGFITVEISYPESCISLGKRRSKEIPRHRDVHHMHSSEPKEKPNFSRTSHLSCLLGKRKFTISPPPPPGWNLPEEHSWGWCKSTALLLRLCDINDFTASCKWRPFPRTEGEPGGRNKVSVCR